MATLAATSLAGPSPIHVNTELTLGSSDTFVWDPTVAKCLLVLRNPTAGALSPTITGSTASSAIPVPGYGTVSASAGLAVGSIAAGAARTLTLDDMSQYLSGTITITGGTGLVATFLKWA